MDIFAVLLDYYHKYNKKGDRLRPPCKYELNYCCWNSGVERYRSPVSQITVTIILP